jgi:hypothetical protein
MFLCALCRNITPAGLLEERPSKRINGGREIGYHHYDALAELERSVETCECCRLIVQKLNKPKDFVLKPHKPHYVVLMGSGLHGVSSMIVIVAGTKLRANFDVVADLSTIPSLKVSH